MNQWIAVGIVGISIGTTPGAGQSSRLTVEGIYGRSEFVASSEPVRWSPDPGAYTVASSESDGRVTIYRVDAATGRRDRLVGSSDLVLPDGRIPSIADYEVSADGAWVLLACDVVPVHHHRRATHYLWNLAERRSIPLSAVSGLQELAKFSPDGRSVGFVRDNNIFVRDLGTGTERQLTTDGTDDVLNGRMDWVYEEEFFFADGLRFSADGKRLAFWRMDQTRIKPFFMMDDRPLYSEPVPIRYPKVGTPNSIVRLGVIDLESGRTSWLDVGAEQDIYVPAMGFSGAEVWFTRINRLQNRVDLLLADPATGRSRVVVTDSNAAWVEPATPIWIKGGAEFLLLSEREGYRQLFRFARDGSGARKVTREPWDVMNVYGVDEARQTVYFTGAGDGPVNQPLYRIGLDGGGFQKLTTDPGTHVVQFNRNWTLYVDEYSRFTVPPVQSIKRVDGTVVRVLANNREVAERVRAAGLRAPEFVSLPGAAGSTLNGYLIRPADSGAAPASRHPLLVYVYGGPGSQTVRDRWDGQRMPWHQLLVQAGYVVASVDGRGTNGRGTAFRKSIYLKMGWHETADQIAAARHLATLPYVDPSRVGIWGWSYGGFVTLLAAMTGEQTFKAAISVASVSDQRFYDTIYAERFMRTPAENAAGYELTAPLTYAGRLAGRLLVVHGMWDDNVHFQNAVLLTQKLAEANRRFDIRFYPFKSHSIPGAAVRVNLFTAMTDWLVQNL